MKRVKFMYVFYVITIIILTVYISLQLYENIKVKQSYSVKGDELPYYNSVFRRPSKNPLLSIELIPNYEGINDGIAVHLKPYTIKINSDGFRDHEYTINKSNDTFRIIALGDSITFSIGLELNDTWPKQLEGRLNRLNNSKKIEVLNFGVPGYNTFEEVEMLKEKGLKYDPNMVILAFIDNDILNNTKMTETIKNLREQYENGTLKIRKDVSVETALAEMATNLQNDEIKSLPFTKVWEIVEKPLEELQRIGKERNITVMIVVFFRSKEQLFALKEFSSKNNLCLIDLQEEVYSKYPFDKMIMNPKDLHPSKFASEVISDKILEKILTKNSLER